MTTVIDKPVIANWALSEIGSFATFTLDGDDDLSGQVELCWQRCVDHTFGLHDWKFCKKTFDLVRTVNVPVNGWPHEFMLPGGRIGDPLKVTTDPASRQPYRNFDLEGDYLYSDVRRILATFKIYRDPEFWDPGFRAAFVIALGAYLAVPVVQDEDLADRLMRRAFGTPSQEGTGGMFGRLMGQNKAASPIGHPLAQSDPLTGARDGGAWPWHGRY